ncbi:hypothetical protein NDU88_004503 [Pleurodeles waltl]|uniref:Uncharacterized protein n=1 Tax=Pleurodeles waltl TaxID=8319 RepID=A0AAV7M797_PLEWA|nr:hypothetical protein NDU88_004503 [Pleurodeles waltl]
MEGCCEQSLGATARRGELSPTQKRRARARRLSLDYFVVVRDIPCRGGPPCIRSRDSSSGDRGELKRGKAALAAHQAVCRDLECSATVLTRYSAALALQRHKHIRYRAPTLAWFTLNTVRPWPCSNT